MSSSFRGQAGVEYVFLVAIVMAASLSLAYFAFQQSQENTRVPQMELAVKQLADAADLVYANGVGARTTVRAYFPPGLNSSSIGGREVFSRVHAAGGTLTDVYRVTQANLTPASLPTAENVYLFTVEFLSNGNVSIYGISEPTPPPTPTPTPTPYPDTAPPLFFSNITNDSEAGMAVLFSLNWTDNQSLQNYTFSFDNGTGSFANDSVVSLTGASNWSNVTKTISQLNDASIRWIVYAWDIVGNANNSGIRSFTTCGQVHGGLEVGNPLSSGFFNESIDSQSKAAYVRWNNCSKFGGFNLSSAAYYSGISVLNRTQARNVTFANWTWFQAATAGNTTTVPYPGPHLSLHFENDSKDSSNRNYTGRVSGNTSGGMFNSSCRVGGCYSFDGSNDFVNLGVNKNLLRNTRTATLSAWINARSIPGGESYVLGISIGSASPTAASRAALLVENSDEVGVIGRAGDGESGDKVTTTSSPIPLNTWRHVVGVINYANDNITIYVNGVQQATSGSASFTATSTSDTPARNSAVGSEDDGSGSFFNGLVDEVHVWPRALTAQEVANLYNYENSGRFDHNTTNATLQVRTKDYSFNDSGLVLWWDLGDENGTGMHPVNRTLDLSGNGNTGNLGNATLGTAPIFNTTHCLIGNCLNFTTQGGRLTHVIRNPVSNFPTTAITAAMWLRAASGDDGTPFSYAVSGTHNEFRIEDVSNIKLLVNGNLKTSDISANDGLWHHVAVSWRSSDGLLVLYRDGVTVFSDTHQAGNPVTSGGSLVVGQDQDTVGNSFDSLQAFNGLIDDVKVWNRTLSAAEIWNLYNNGAPAAPGAWERNWTAFTGELGGPTTDNVSVTLAAGKIAQYKANLYTDSNRSYSPFFLGATYLSTPYGSPPATPVVRALATYFDSGSPNNVRYREYDNYSGWSAERNAQNIGGDNRPWHVLRAAPTRNEMISVVQDTANNIFAQVWNSGGWNNLTTLSSAGGYSNAVRSFDAAYEESSGDALVVYRKSSDADTPYYRVWNGSSWSSEAAATTLSSGQNIEWLRLVAKNNSDEMILTGHTSAKFLHLLVWNGTGWSSVTTAETNTNCVYECFDLAYERSSGEGLVAYRDGNNNAPRYRTYSGGSWSSESNAGDVGGRPGWIRLSSNPTSNEIIMAVLDESNDLNSQAWSGTAWGSNSELEGSMETDDQRAFDAAFQANGTALLVYSESGVETPRYRLYSTSSGWTPESSALNVRGDVSWVALAANSSSNEILSLTVDNENSDLAAQRWTGSGWVEFEFLEQSSYNTPSFAAAYRRG